MVSLWQDMNLVFFSCFWNAMGWVKVWYLNGKELKGSAGKYLVILF